MGLNTSLDIPLGGSGFFGLISFFFALLFLCIFLLFCTRESSVVFLLSVFDTWLVLCVLSHSMEFSSFIRFILTPNRAPQSICFSCSRYLLFFLRYCFSFLCVHLHLLFWLGFQSLYLMLIAMSFSPSILRLAFCSASFSPLFFPFAFCFPCTCFYAVYMYYT